MTEKDYTIIKEGNRLSLLFPDGIKKNTIGYLDPADSSVIKMYRDRDKHLMYKLDAYGFNYQFMSVAAKGNIETIILREKNGNTEVTYLIPVSEVSLNSIPNEYGNFEKQMFYPLKRLLQQPNMEKTNPPIDKDIK
jgi:hypothetical protein